MDPDVRQRILRALAWLGSAQSDAFKVWQAQLILQPLVEDPAIVAEHAPRRDR
jgi:hypothetical protein